MARSSALDGRVVEIQRVRLAPGPWQPRRVFDAESLDELATSIRARGILSPLRVVPDPESKQKRFLIVAGERRWRAAELAGLSELPCFVMDGHTGAAALQELAILDNLHRANLRPGEEARAVAQLLELDLSVQDMALRLGKSQAWVRQRLAIAHLPDSAIEQLDDGLLTREEALGLARFADDVDLIEACLELNGKRLAQRLGGHVPETVGERVQAVRRVLEMQRQRQEWAASMRAAGHRVLDETPHEGDRKYVKLLQGSEVSRAHQQAGLSCELWAWDRGQPVRYCDKPRALKDALADAAKFDAAEQARLAEHQRTLAREAHRDATLRAWLATSRGVETRDLSLLARERITTLSLTDDRLLAMLGAWLGVSGDRSAAIAMARQELAGASETRLIQLWFLVEAANTMASTVVPQWLQPWLARLGVGDTAPSVGAAR